MDSLGKIYKKLVDVFKLGFVKLIKVLDRFRVKKDMEFDNGQEQIELDKKLVFSLSKSRIPNLQQIKYIKKFLTPSELLVMRISIAVIVVCLVFLGGRFYKNHLQLVSSGRRIFRSFSWLTQSYQSLVCRY